MKSNSTALWLVLAVLLAAAIWIVDKYFQPSAPSAPPLLAGLRAAQVSRVQVTPGADREISVVRTNKAWLLEKPLTYPAQSPAVDGLLEALENLNPTLSVPAGELNGHKDADAEFGFDTPQFRLDLSAAGHTWRLLVGNKTATGDGVYVRVNDAADIFVTDAKWLPFLPRDANAWRDTTLVASPALVDWLIITNGAQAIELRRDPTNRLWRMIGPLPCRANNLLIVSSLEQLRTASVSKFVSDDPKADFAAYGLEPAALSIWLGTATNLMTAIHAGKDVPGSTREVYAQREGLNSIVATPKEPLNSWRGQVNDFRDPNLMELTAPVAEVEVRIGTNAAGFTLQQKATNIWTMAGEKFLVDTPTVVSFIRTLTELPIAAFVQDAVTASGLQSFGLASPGEQIILRSAVGDTNAVIAHLLFGASTNNIVYVKRSDEDFVYAVDLNRLNALPLNGDDYRDHRPWFFSENDVAQVTIHQNGKMRQMARNGTNSWSLAAGSGIIEPHAVEEAVHQMGQFQVMGWIGRKFSDEAMGLATNGLSITFELKSGPKHTIQFGRDIAEKTALAVVTMDGERWGLVFPTALYPIVAESLTIPANAP